jgi:hypothetical protein
MRKSNRERYPGHIAGMGIKERRLGKRAGILQGMYKVDEICQLPFEPHHVPGQEGVEEDREAASLRVQRIVHTY